MWKESDSFESKLKCNKLDFRKQQLDPPAFSMVKQKKSVPVYIAERVQGEGDMKEFHFCKASLYPCAGSSTFKSMDYSIL